MTVIPIRTNAGGILSLEVTPADVVGQCDKCLKRFREGDWYCAHLTGPGRTIARLDASGPPASGAPDHRAVGALMPVFRAPGA